MKTTTKETFLEALDISADATRDMIEAISEESFDRAVSEAETLYNKTKEEINKDISNGGQVVFAAGLLISKINQTPKFFKEDTNYVNAG